MAAIRTSWLVLLAACSSPDLSAPAPIGTEPTAEPEVQAFTLSPEPTVEPPIAVYDASPPAPVETTEPPPPPPPVDECLAPCGAGFNCDPACGPVTPGCDACTTTGTLDFGETFIRTPPASEEVCSCGATWTAVFRIPDPACILVVGPYGISTIRTIHALAGTEPVADCDRSPSAGIAVGGAAREGSTPVDFYLELSLIAPTPGASFRVVLLDPDSESCGNNSPPPDPSDCSGPTPLTP